LHRLRRWLRKRLCRGLGRCVRLWVLLLLLVVVVVEVVVRLEVGDGRLACGRLGIESRDMLRGGGVVVHPVVPVGHLVGRGRKRHVVSGGGEPGGAERVEGIVGGVDVVVHDVDGRGRGRGSGGSGGAWRRSDRRSGRERTRGQPKVVKHTIRTDLEREARLAG